MAALIGSDEDGDDDDDDDGESGDCDRDTGMAENAGGASYC